MKKRIVNFIFYFLICSLTFITMSISVNAATGSDIVTEARKWIGTPYISSNGNGGYGSGVDCSGLTLQVYSKFGITLPWYADSQRNYGTPIGHYDLKISNSHSNLQLGDLIFFDYKDDGVADHVAIYAGSGNIIHATNKRGVVEAPLSWNTGVINGQRFYNAVCEVRRLVGGGGTTNSKPTNVNISVHGGDESNHFVGDAVPITYHADGAEYYNMIMFKDQDIYYQDSSTTGYCNASFDNPGHYCCYIEAVNKYGTSTSRWVGWNVYTKADIHPDKSIYCVGETVTIQIGGDETDKHYIGVHKGEEFYTGNYIDGNTFSFPASEIGEYKANMDCFFETGTLRSDWCYFTIANKSSISINKGNNSTYTLGETVNINVSNDSTTSHYVGIHKYNLSSGEYEFYTGDYVNNGNFDFIPKETGQYKVNTGALINGKELRSDFLYFTVSAKPSKPSLNYMQKHYNINYPVLFEWDETTNTTDYELDIYKMEETFYNGHVLSRSYKLYRTITGNGIIKRYLPKGEYKVVLRAVNKNSWAYDEEAGQYPFSESNSNYFTVSDEWIPTHSDTLDYHRYLLLDYSVSWHEAKEICEELGGHLAIVSSKEEYDLIQNLIKNGYKASYFLGATDEVEEGKWKTVCDDYLCDSFYENIWQSGEPNNAGEKEHYLEINEAGGNDVPADVSVRRGLICEIDSPHGYWSSLSYSDSGEIVRGKIGINYINERTPGVLVIAGYKNGVQVAQEIKSLENYTENSNIYFMKGKGVDSVKIFIWDNMENMIPLIDPIILSKK